MSQKYFVFQSKARITSDIFLNFHEITRFGGYEGSLVSVHADTPRKLRIRLQCGTCLLAYVQTQYVRSSG